MNYYTNKILKVNNWIVASDMDQLTVIDDSLNEHKQKPFNGCIKDIF